MAEVTATAVRDLREKTGAGMLDCKKALVENAGDIEKAIEWLRKKGLSAADKKSSRTAAEGSVTSFVSTDNKVGVLVEINCETDFVAKNDDFKNFAKDLTTVLATTPNLGTNGQETAGTQAGQLTLKSSGKTVEITAKELVAKIGENIVFRRFARLEGGANSAVTSYVHGDGKIGVLLEVAFTNAATASNDKLKAFGKDVAMHIAAVNPRFVGPEGVPADVTANEKRILTEQAAASGKPANVIEKMVEGRLQKFLGDICLLKQPFVKNPDQTVETVQKEVSAALGDTLTVKRFIRMQMGEGIEKKSDDFAAEVAKMAGTNN